MADACCKDWPWDALVKPLHVFIHLSLAAAASTALGVYLDMSGVQADGLTGPAALAAAARAAALPEFHPAAAAAFKSFDRLL